MHTFRGVALLREMHGEEPPEQWLSPAEWSQYESDRRRPSLEAWLCGRWCAKQVVRQVPSYERTPFRKIHIESRDGSEQRVAPRVFVRGRLQPWRLSLSHGRRLCSAVLSVEENQQVGTDVISLSENVKDLEEYWFNAHEQQWCNGEVAQALIWGLKEAIYKSQADGSRFVPREIDTTAWIKREELRRLAESSTGSISLTHGAELNWESHEDELALYFIKPSFIDTETSNEVEHQKVVLQ